MIGLRVGKTSGEAGFEWEMLGMYVEGSYSRIYEERFIIVFK